MYRKYLSLTVLMVLLIAVPSLSLAQQAPPPRVIGSVHVDQITQAPVQIIRGVSLNATPQDVFTFISNHQNWPGLFSSIESVSVTGHGRKGSTRSFTLAGDISISERIVAFSEPGNDGSAAFAYSVEPGNPFGVEGHLAVIELRAADDGGTVLHYHQHFNHPDLNAVLPAVAGGTDEILANILYRFGGELRGTSYGTEQVVIEQRRVVDASQQRVWKVLGEEWADVDKWASTVSHSEMSGGGKGSLKGATRSCEVPGTPGFRETMIAYDEDALMLSYQVLDGMPPFIQKATNTWNVEPLGQQRMVVTSRIGLKIAPGTPAPAVGMVKGQFTQLLDLTFDELAHYIETQRPHPRKVAASKMMASSAAGRK